MLHACFYTICLAFRYTSWRFYVISRTNLLTRCHSASSLFFAGFEFQKSYTGNILRIGRNKFQKSYFSRKSIEDRTRARGGQGPASPWGGAAQPLAAPPVVRPPWSPPDDAPSPIKSLPIENPKTIGIFPRTVPQRCRHRRQILGDISLYFGTLPGRGSAPGAILSRPRILSNFGGNFFCFYFACVDWKFTGI
jgi:hypothetical protein